MDLKTAAEINTKQGNGGHTSNDSRGGGAAGPAGRSGSSTTLSRMPTRVRRPLSSPRCELELLRADCGVDFSPGTGEAAPLTSMAVRLFPEGGCGIGVLGGAGVAGTTAMGR